MKAPSYLSKNAKQWWKKLEDQYEFTNDTYMLLITLLECFDEYQKARELLTKGGPLIKSKNGVIKKNPCIELLKVSRSQFLATWRLLGFNISPPDGLRR